MEANGVAISLGFIAKDKIIGVIKEIVKTLAVEVSRMLLGSVKEEQLVAGCANILKQKKFALGNREKQKFSILNHQFEIIKMKKEK